MIQNFHSNFVIFKLIIKVLPVDHLQDEIKLQNNLTLYEKPNKNDLELLWLRSDPIRRIYDDIRFMGWTDDNQKKFLHSHLFKYQFKSLPSYDFRVKFLFYFFYSSTQNLKIIFC